MRDERVELVRRNLRVEPGNTTNSIPTIWIVELIEAYDELERRLSEYTRDERYDGLS